MTEEEKRPGSRPYTTQKILLQSFHAQQVFKRGFSVFTKSIYSLSVILRSIAEAEDLNKVIETIDEKIQSTSDDLETEIKRFNKLAEDNGITLGKIDYSNPSVVEAKISSHRSAQFVNIIRKYDDFISHLDALWLSGIIPDLEYSNSIYEWKRRILRIASHTNGVLRNIAAESRKRNVSEVNTSDPEKSTNTNNQAFENNHPEEQEIHPKEIKANVSATQIQSKSRVLSFFGRD